MGPDPVGSSLSPGPTASPRLRIATYNILLGGGGRWAEIGELLETIDADVVALQEVIEPAPLAELARRLGYELFFAEAATPRHQAVLSRVPVRSWINHRDATVFLRNSLELRLQLGEGAVLPELCLHTVHLTAAFHRRQRAEPERARELAAVLRQADAHPELPHLVVGDFNALAPGDRVRATAFFAQLNQWRRSGALRAASPVGPIPAALSSLGWWQDSASREEIIEELPEVVRWGMPRLPWLVHPLLEVVPRGETTDAVLGALLPRSAIRGLLRAGYRDCLRHLHPSQDGFSCPTYRPAVRIDYVFATAALASRLRACRVVGRSGELAALARRASDHFPVVAEFALGQ